MNNVDKANAEKGVALFLRSSSLSNCSLLGSRFARSCSTRPSQRSKYTGGVALRMRICIAVQRLSRKCAQKKNTPGTARALPVFEGEKWRRLDSNVNLRYGMSSSSASPKLNWDV